MTAHAVEEEEELRNIGAHGDPEKNHPRRRRRSVDAENGHRMRCFGEPEQDDH